MKKRWDWMAICAFLIYIAQYITFKKFLDTNITVFLVLFSAIFLVYLIYGFYFIFKVNSGKGKVWKRKRAVLACMFLLLFVGLCMYFISCNIGFERERIFHELIIENKGTTADYYQISQKEDFYRYLGNVPIVIGLLGILYSWIGDEY